MFTHHRSISQFVFSAGPRSRAFERVTPHCQDRQPCQVCVCVLTWMFGGCRDSLIWGAAYRLVFHFVEFVHIMLLQNKKTTCRRMLELHVFSQQSEEEQLLELHLQRRQTGDAIQRAHQVGLDEEVLLARQLRDARQTDGRWIGRTQYALYTSHDNKDSLSM